LLLKVTGQGASHEYIPDNVRNAVFRIYRGQSLPIRVDEDEFKRSMSERDSILVTLRAYRENGTSRSLDTQRVIL